MSKYLTVLFVLVLAGVSISAAQLSDTLYGPVKGTTMPNRSYVVKDSITINVGDTLTISAGDTLYMMNDPITGAACWIHILGTFICDGTPTNHNIITTDFRDSTGHPGLWGGIVGDSCKYVNVQYTEARWAGGVNAIGHTTRTFDISSNYANTTNTIFRHNIVEGTSDDCIGLEGGNASVMYNTLKWVGAPDGDNFNIKAGCVGEIAYNTIWAGGGNGIKMTSDPTLPRATNMCIHNNTIVATGWRRRPEVGFAILVDNSARAEIYNNIFGDNYGDIEITNVADTARTVYQNNLFFYSVDSLKGVSRYYPTDGVGKPVSNDILNVQADSLFVNYHPYFYNGWLAMDEKNDYHILATSAAVGSGITPPAPTLVNHWGNPYFGNGTQTLPGDQNIGALGVGSISAINEHSSNTPNKFTLNQNYPNPFNPSTKISYTLKESGQTSLQIYNVIGQLVMTVDQGFRQAGQTYNFTVSMDRFASGIYFYTLREGSNLLTKKMILLK